jgi:hypothetical protein
VPVLMPSPVFRWFVPAQNGTGLVPAAGYKAKFYSAGTDIAKTIYELDDTPYPTPSNEAELNSEGFAGIKLGPGSYKLVVTDPDDAEVYTQDNINGDGAFGTGFVETVMPQDPAPTFGPNGLAAAPVENKFTWCGGYWAIGDGGHGFFWNEESSDPDDGGYVIASDVDPTVRWFREPDEDGQVRTASFGYVGTRAEDLTNELLAAAGYCQANDKTLRIGPGSAATFGVSGQTYNFYTLVGGIVFEPGAMITGNAGVTALRLWGKVSGPPAQIFTDIPIQIMTSQVLENPEWFGASRSAPDNTEALNDWFGCFGSEDPAKAAFILPPGQWDILGGTDTIDFPTETPYILLGTIVGDESSAHGMYFPSAGSVAQFDYFRLGNGAVLTESGASDGQFTGRLLTQGLTATGTVLSSSNVVAGNGGTEGYLVGGVGQSGTAFRAGGGIRQAGGNTTTSGSTLTPLISTSLEPDTLVFDGDRVTVRAGGTMTSDGTGGTDGKRFVLTIGGQTVFDKTIHYLFTGSDILSGGWTMQVDVFRDIEGSYLAYGFVVSSISDADQYESKSASDFRTGSVDWGGALTIQMSGQNIDGNGSITGRVITADYFPQPPA